MVTKRYRDAGTGRLLSKAQFDKKPKDKVIAEVVKPRPKPKPKGK